MNIIHCEKIMRELEFDACKYGNDAFRKNKTIFFLITLCTKAVKGKNSKLLILCDSAKLIAKLICKFAFGFKEIIEKNIKKQLKIEKILLKCVCCWRHYDNNDTMDFGNYKLFGDSKAKCMLIGCFCPCRYLYRRLLWMKETQKLIVDCPKYKLCDLWKRYR